MNLVWVENINIKDDKYHMMHTKFTLYSKTQVSNVKSFIQCVYET